MASKRWNLSSWDGQGSSITFTTFNIHHLHLHDSKHLFTPRFIQSSTRCTQLIASDGWYRTSPTTDLEKNRTISYEMNREEYIRWNRVSHQPIHLILDNLYQQSVNHRPALSHEAILRSLWETPTTEVSNAIKNTGNKTY